MKNELNRMLDNRNFNTLDNNFEIGDKVLNLYQFIVRDAGVIVGVFENDLYLEKVDNDLNIFIINTSNKSFYFGKINGLKNNIGVLDSLYKEEHYDGILQYIKFINLESNSLIYELLEYSGEDKIKLEINNILNTRAFNNVFEFEGNYKKYGIDRYNLIINSEEKRKLNLRKKVKDY